MKVLVESYNVVMQNVSGGISVRIKNFIEQYRKSADDIKLFNKWTDKVTDYDILHIFKANIEDYQLMKLANNNNTSVIISAVIPYEKHMQIVFNRVLCKILPIHTGYWFLNQMLLKADAVITQTKKESNFINKFYKIPLNRLHVIPNGVNIHINEDFKDEFKKRTGITGKYVLQVGRFDKNKNQISVIKAMANSDIPVVFIGGEDIGKPGYFKECKMIATPNIHFLGWVNHEDPLLSSAYQNAHVVILPSYKEIFGNSLIEGGVAGANLIATRELPIFDWGIKNICTCINPNNLKDIKDKIITAYNNPLNPKTSAIIQKKFSWDTVIEQHIEIYNQVLHKQG